MYDYRTMPVTHVLGLTTAYPRDGYLSEDRQLQTYRKLLADGYRWVRTDGDFAVFEKVVQ